MIFIEAEKFFINRKVEIDDWVFYDSNELKEKLEELKLVQNLIDDIRYELEEMIEIKSRYEKEG